ncbi:MAG: SMP-30/gluconolactonase/LRE family protein [Ferroplasma sp.]
MKANVVKGSPKCILGESPIWIKDTLYFIDIKKGMLYSYKDDFSSIKLGNMITFIVPAKNGIVFSTRSEIRYINMDTKEQKTLFSMDFDSNIRFNDGKCDSNGRLFAGTMDINEKNPVAALYKFDSGKSEVLKNITISNGTIWSPDNKTLYYIDSPTKKIRVFDYSIKNGNILNEKKSIDVSYSPGVPDGMTIDLDGNLYVCFFGGSHVLNINPDGKLINDIKVDAKNVSSCIFGGPELNKLYITTAMDANSMGGELFEFDSEAHGMNGNSFAFVE